jgi:hypothetical protein
MTLRPKARLTATVARPAHVARHRHAMVNRRDPEKSTRCLPLERLGRAC